MRFLAMLRVQWQWLRNPLLILSLAALAAPTIGLAGITAPDAAVDGSGLISRGEVVGALLGVLSVVTGLVAAQVLWSADERVGHGYALSLPIDRSLFLRFRVLGGLLLLLVPALAVFLGVGLAAARVEIAPGIRAYAAWTAWRALASMTLAFALMVFVRYALTTRVRRGLLIAAAVLVTVMVLESELRQPHHRPVGAAVRQAFMGRYSPFSVVIGTWRIVDV